MNKEKLREELAELCHTQWSGWVSHVFTNCAPWEAERMILSSSRVKRWSRQMELPYGSLSFEEKELDRLEADKFIALIEKHMEEEDER